MKKSFLLILFLVAGVAGSLEAQTRIRHMAVFTLIHPTGSAGEEGFLEAIRELAGIPGVEKFECVREISPKNTYQFAVSMEFAGNKEYEAYNVHPAHVSFVENRWKKEVKEFIEIDFALP